MEVWTWSAATLAEVEELIGTVTFGKEKLAVLFAQLQNLEKKIINGSERRMLEDLADQCIRLRGSIQATGNSLRLWQEKARGFLQILKAADDLEVPLSHKPAQSKDMQRKIYQLLKMVTSQTNRVQQMQQQLIVLNELLQEKRLLLQPKIARGQAPKLAYHS